jgi:hypothetical protein
MFSGDTARELRRLIGQLRLSGNAIAFRGNRYAVSPGQEQAALANILYAECYALKDIYQEGNAAKAPYDPAAGQAFVERLSASNHTAARTEKGWQVTKSFANGYAGISRNGMTLAVPPAFVGPTPDAPAEGQEWTVFFPKEDRWRQPTFYYAFSNGHVDPERKLTRIYWNITQEGAPLLVDAVTRTLNRYRIPFLFKCLSHPALYFRRDAAVLYVDDTMMPMLGRLLPGIRESVAPFLDADVPLFTFRYDNGIGMADDPNAHESFGVNRTQAVAAALLEAPAAGPEQKLAAIAGRFFRNGIDPARPYLNKGSKILIHSAI